MKWEIIKPNYGFPIDSEVSTVFYDIGGVINNWQMIALRAKVKMVDAPLKELFERAEELFIYQDHFTLPNFLVFVEFKERLLNLKTFQFDHEEKVGDDDDERRRQLFFDRCVQQIEETLKDFLEPFLKKYAKMFPGNDRSPNKLIWKGQKNQMYYLLRLLKNRDEKIGNSFRSLAQFLISNVTGFEGDSIETIDKELRRDYNLPKSKRLDFDLDKANEEK